MLPRLGANFHGVHFLSLNFLSDPQGAIPTGQYRLLRIGNRPGQCGRERCLDVSESPRVVNQLIPIVQHESTLPFLESVLRGFEATGSIAYRLLRVSC